MRILVVDDNEEKSTEIRSVLLAIPGIESADVVVVDCVVQAKRELLTNSYDLLIVDIQLPLHSKERPKVDGGATLLEEIRLGRRYNVPVHVIGLTAYEESETLAIKVFAENSSVIIRFDRSSDRWHSRLGNRVEQILGQDLKESEPTNEEHIVVLIHGIRTHASWAEMVSSVIEHKGIQVVPVRYGYFDVFQFLIPIFTRRAPIVRIVRELRDIRAEHPNANISVIAHSFGTYGLSKALENPDIRLFRIILCGCIIPENFRRARFRGQLGPEPILNDCGTHDIWPVLAKGMTWGYGATGTFGFGTSGIRDRFNKFGHGDYFDRTFVETYWIPFLLSGEIRATDWETVRTTPPLWESVLSRMSLKYLLLGAVLFLILKLCRVL